jgi:hypothetical protein
VAVVASLAFARRREELTCVTSAVCPLPTAPRPPRDCFPHSTRTAAACISNPESVGGVGEHDCSAAPKQERPERLYEVQERVYGGRTGLAPVREAVPTPARVVGRHVDRFWRAAFHDVYVDAPACQRAALEDGGDRRPNLCVRGAHLRPVHHMPRRRVHSAPPAPAFGCGRVATDAGGGDHTGDLVKRHTLEQASPPVTWDLARPPPGSRNHGSHAAWPFLRRRKTPFRDSPRIWTESMGAMQSAERVQVAGERFRHLAGHRMDDPNGDVGMARLGHGSGWRQAIVPAVRRRRSWSPPVADEVGCCDGPAADAGPLLRPSEASAGR